ncbi:hypothetical protein [Bradyrhizobium sp. UFLA05-112]
MVRYARSGGTMTLQQTPPNNGVPVAADAPESGSERRCYILLEVALTYRANRWAQDHARRSSMARKERHMFNWCFSGTGKRRDVQIDSISLQRNGRVLEMARIGAPE